MMRELKTLQSIVTARLISLIYYFIDILFPAECVSCGTGISNNNYGICQQCIERINFIADSCPRCSGILVKDECSLCSSRVFFLKKNRTLTEYSGIIKDMIIALKFKKMKKIAYYFGLILSQEITRDNDTYDLITYVPMNKKKRWTRGFNQSEIISRVISKRNKIELKRLLKEKKQSGVQKSMGFTDRFINVIGRYYSSDKKAIQGKKVLLIDDVLTTGATLNECARILLENGASEVSSMTVARVAMNN